MRNNGIFRSILTSAMALSLFLFLASCGGGGGGDEGSGTGVSGSITITVSSSIIPVADNSSSVIITATIKDSAGNPVRHYTDVLFKTTLGHFRNGSSYITVQTQPPLDANGWPNWEAAPTGVVQVALIAGKTPGTTKVTVNSNNVSQSTYVKIGTVPVDAASITLVANPTAIPADGLTSTQIQATLTDGTGAPVTAGIQVNFTTTLGTFVNGTQSYTTVTPDANGIVSVALIASTTAGSARVVATSNNVSQVVYVGFGGKPVSITLTADPTTIAADGVSASTITAIIKDANGASVIPGTSITFTTTLGSFLNGMKNYTVKTADNSGVVIVSLISSTGTGSARVAATSNGITQSIYIGFGGAPVAITITANPTSIWADGKSSSAIQVALTDGTGAAVTPGTLVTFTTTLGTFSNGSQSYTVSTQDNTGIVTTSLIAGTTTGAALVSATSNSVTQSVYVTFTEKGGNPFSISLAADPTSIPADGMTSSRITATLTDSAGNPVNPGASVTFSTTLGRFSNGSKTYTVTTPDTTGVVSVSLIAGSTSGAALVSATASGVTQSVYVTFEGGDVSIVLTANPTSIAANGQSSTVITATLTDKDKNPVTSGTSVQFTTTLGTFSNGAQNITKATTDNTGIVSVKLISGTTPGVAIVGATVNGVTQSVQVTFAGGAASITLTADPKEIPADGSSSSIITAEVKDSTGNPVAAGTNVTFTTNIGTFSNGTTTYATATADGTGIVTVALVAGNTGGSAIVVAASGGISQSVVVNFISNVVANIALTANPSTLIANGKSQSTIRATVTDANGNPVADGEQISFVITSGLGTLSASSATCTSGIAEVTYTSATTAGSVTIKASSVNSISATTTIVLTNTDVGSIEISANPTSIPANGSSSSTITATLKDTTGNPVTTGTSVTFSTTLGVFSNGGTTFNTTTPDETGVVSVSLKAGYVPGSAMVSAASNGVMQAVYVAIGSGSISITLVASPTSIPADGTSSSKITATLTGSSGTPVAPGTSVTFKTTLGKFSNNQVVYTVTTLDSTGVVSVSLKSSTTPGTALVSAESGNVSQGVFVKFTSGTQDVGSVEISADPSSIPADGTSTSVITATVKTPDNQVIEGIEVAFKTSLGAITSPHDTDANGHATATLTSARSVDDNVQVTATCQGKSATTIVAFGGVILTVTATPPSLLTGETSNLIATLKDASGNPIGNATVILSTDKGTLNQSQTTTNGAGQVSGTLTSAVSGIATVTATGNGATGTTTVTFTQYQFTLEADPTTIRVGGETSLITATLLDNAAPSPGAIVTFSSTLGTVNPVSAATQADGKASTTLTSGDQSGIAVIDANVTVGTPATSLSANTQVVITGGDASKIVLTANPTVISVNTGVATITAQVYDINDQPSANQNIYFRINTSPGGGEYLSASVKVTNTYGIATVSFFAGALPSAYNDVEIEANTEPDFTGSYGLTTLTIAGPVASISVGIDLHTLEIVGGDLVVDVSANATDVNGNPVADGTKVSFSVQSIEFDEDRADDHEIDCWDSARNPLIPCPAVGTAGFGTTWFSDDVNQDGTMYSLGGPMSTTEDVNHNGILDPGEDKNDNGVIDPIQGSVIGDNISTVDGVATTTLTYSQSFANNIMVKITADSGGVSNFYETILLCTVQMVEQGTCGIGY